MVEQVKTKTEPYVRFRGFTDEWEEVKLGDVADIVRGSSPRPIHDPKWFDSDSDVGWLRISDVTEQDGRIYHLDQKISKAGQEKTRVVLTPHLLLSIAATVGKPVVNYVKTGVHDGFLIFENPTFNQEFLFQWLEMFRPKWQKYGQPGSQVNLNSKIVKTQDILIPDIPEQQKIGDLFQTLDKTIDLSNTQVENLKQQKKALLQRLFPQKGETEPKVRLRGFKDAWEEVKLGDVFSVYSKKGRTDLPFVTVGERETNERTTSAQGYGNDVSDKARAKAKVLLSGQFLIDLSSYGRGIYMSRMDGVTSSAYNVLNLDNGADSYWVEYLISHDFVESLKRLTPPGARQGKMIEVDGLLKTKTFVPSPEEQQAIGELFQTVDEQIRLAEDKVSQYKKLKQALLQRLFV